MKRFAQQFKKQSIKIKLSAQEQFLLRERINTFMEYHPLPMVEGEVKTVLSLDKVFKTAKFPWKKLRMSVGVVVMAFIVALPAVAEYTLPGDILYPVKVRINEEVRSTLARTPYEKVEWESKRIERRVSEARDLAKAGLLTPEAEEAAANAVSQHRSNANAEIAILQESNNTDEATLANMTLSSVFEVQSTAYRIDNESTIAVAMTSTSSTEINPRTLAAVLEGGRAELALLNETNNISYGRLMAEIEKQTTRAYERLASIKLALSDSEATDISRRLDAISARILAAKKLSEEDGSEELRQALKDSQKLIAFMNNIDVRGTISVERIVPVTPTFEERLKKLTPQVEELTLEVQKIELVTKQISKEEVRVEIISEIDELKLYIEKANQVTPKNIRNTEAELVIMKDRALELRERVISAGGDFKILEVDIITGNISTNSSSATSTSSSR